MSSDTRPKRSFAPVLACCAALALAGCAGTASSDGRTSGPAQMQGDDLRGPLSPGYKWGQ